MATIKARRGLDLPIHGAPSDAAVVDRLDVNRVALLPQEVLGAKVRLLSQEGDTVQVGTPLMCDRRDEAALFTSPAAGKITAIHRGKRRAVLSIVVEATGYDDAVPFHPVDVSAATRDEVKQALLGSGLWPTIRRRPFDRVAISTDEPAAIIVQAYDSSPLAPDLTEVVAGRDSDLKVGLAALRKLTDGLVHVAVKDGVRWGRFLDDGIRSISSAGRTPPAPRASRSTACAPPAPTARSGTSACKTWPTWAGSSGTESAPQSASSASAARPHARRRLSGRAPAPIWSSSASVKSRPASPAS